MVTLVYDRVGYGRVESEVFVPDDLVVDLLWDFLRRSLERRDQLIPGERCKLVRVDFGQSSRQL